MRSLRAIVLAAGSGSRLWPYTTSRPKPMVPIAGRPILEWPLAALAEEGVRDVQVVVGYKGSRIQTHFEDGRKLGLRISYVRQEVLLGTGAAVAVALEAGGVPDEALIIGGDNIVGAPLVKRLLAAGPNALAVAKSSEPSKYGVVTVRGTDVVAIEEKPPLTGEALVSTGAALLDREILAQLPRLVRAGQLGLAQMLHEIASSGPGLQAVVDAGLWLDAVYPWDLLRLTDLLLTSTKAAGREGAQVEHGAVVADDVFLGHGAVIETGAIVRGPTSIGRNARIAAGAVVAGSIVMEDAYVGPGAFVERAVIGDGSRIHGGARLARGRGIAETTDGVHLLEDTGPIVGEGCTIEGGATLLPGLLMGNGSRVRAGATARGRIGEGGEVL